MCVAVLHQRVHGDGNVVVLHAYMEEGLYVVVVQATQAGGVLEESHNFVLSARTFLQTCNVHVHAVYNKHMYMYVLTG